ncbi:lysine-specific demethylase 2A-like [Salvelinus namaycush]|uniref:[histone H3]-dimethyl-L-lysine(36) demethylase n=1 Tax=Salvelinus namaycush TaxID=8040 RepID=A0A8U1H0Q7_SALNM|nr:lysine-specific demethylase 2A-like [Salvelinus namaycush]
MEDQNPRYSKRLRTGTRRRYLDDGISDDEIEGKRTFDLDEKLQSDRFNSNLVKHMEGKDFTFEYIQREGLRDPLIFEKKDGLGLEMPDSDFSVSDVKLFVGSRRMVDVMDVTTQKGIEMSMAQWRRYYETPPSERDKLYNVISLEFSHTKLENLVKRPASVDLIDWVDNMWPRHLKERQRDSTNSIIDMQYPKVQKYCLMSVQGCFTDFHVDFGGTSVWYHILRGGKVFWLIPPTPQNLELYEDWVLSGKQGDIFLGDKARDCQRIELKQGYTFMIPSGWIHAVYTPEDTLVFGGNFLHSFNIPMQLNIYNIEDRTRVPAKFRYPFYYEMCWYVLERYLYCLTNTSHLTPEFQKHSLGVGLTRDSSENKLNGHVKNGTSEENKDGDDDEEGKEEERESKVKMEESDEDVSPALGATKLGVRVNLTPLELEGLWNLLGKLEELPAHKKCVPAGIRNAPALLHDIRALLEDHRNDDPKLSYTGKPIVKWPKRPSWYQPPSPSPVDRPRPATPHKPTVPRPARPAASISALRRRRVRCKRCAGCQREECGECNFCRDMRRFGGPGRMKKGCMMRQCLAPGLPNSAVCVLCGEGQGKQELADASPSSTTLMECSNCAQIAHPDCIKVPGEGRINKDLPSCWECPKCYQDKDGSSSESSSSDEDSMASTGSLTTSKHAHREGIGVGEAGGGVRKGRRGRPPLTSSLSQRRAPPPSQRLLLQQQQNRKRAGALELRLRKSIKLERSTILESKQTPYLERSHKLLGSQRLAHLQRGVSSRLHSPVGRLSRGRGSFRGSPTGARLQPPQPSLSVAPAGRGEGRRGQGRGVRLRGGAAGRGRGGQRHGGAEEESDSSTSSSSSSSCSSDEEEEDRENGVRSGRRDKENRPQRRGRGTAKEDEGGSGESNQNEEEEMDEDWREGGQAQAEPPVLVVSDISDDFMKGSYLTVTLQPSRAKHDPGAIVPKLEAAVTPRPAPPGQIYTQRKNLARPPLRNHAPDPARSDRHTHIRGSNTHTGGSHQDERRTRPGRPERTNNGASSSRVPPLHLPLSALQDGEREVADGGSEPGCEREVWVSVFRYLTRAELCVCMAVCKNWYKWSLDKRLWMRINLTVSKAISPQALSGIIKRQPVALDLSWTSISKKQLTWLVNRLPGLKDLMLSGCSWSSISALSSTSCPLLRTLDLRWADGVKDGQIRDLLNPPGCDNRSQLRNMQSFRLAGLEISDSTLRLVIRHMPLLTRLDLSHCGGLTDHSINLLTAVGSSTRNTLTELNLGGCSKLTDACLRYLRRLSCLSLLDLRECKGVSRKACEAFISELSVNALYCLSEDKLIQRIS